MMIKAVMKSPLMGLLFVQAPIIPMNPKTAPAMPKPIKTQNETVIYKNKLLRIILENYKNTK